MAAGLTIGRAAREAGVGIETIRFYERQRLVAQPPRPQGAGVRLYPTETVERIRARFNPELSILGVALTMFDKRNNLSAQVADDVRACLGKVVFETVIPRNVRLSEAPSHGIPALIYDLRCPGSEAYVSLAKELIKRLPQPAEAA